MYYGPSRLLVVALLQHLMEWLSWSVAMLSTSNIILVCQHVQGHERRPLPRGLAVFQKLQEGP